MFEICVVHLVWVPLGIEPFARFISSYRQHRAGVDHHLVIVFNGVQEKSGLEEYYALLAGLDYSTHLMPRPTLDIPAYLSAARSVECQYVCFLNSYSEILVDNWLTKLHCHIARAGVGLVGATGSYESLYSAIIHTPPNRSGAFFKDAWERLRKRLFINNWHRMNFPPFPNYHIRSNAFMIARNRLLKLKGAAVRSKIDAYKFESGKSSMTRQILGMNLKALIIGRNGEAYEPPRWQSSNTFRSGNQSNLLVADNRTDQFMSADPATQKMLSDYAWGKR